MCAGFALLVPLQLNDSTLIGAQCPFQQCRTMQAVQTDSWNGTGKNEAWGWSLTRFAARYPVNDGPNRMMLWPRDHAQEEI